MVDKINNTHKLTGRRTGFTIVELLIVIVVIGVLAAITIIAYNGVQSRARDNGRITKITSIAKAIELYKVDNGRYPPIQDMSGYETTCGSATENWGHCDRARELANMLAPYITIEPTSLSVATTGSHMYRYTSQSTDNFQTYGLMVLLEGAGGQNDGGYYANGYELGGKPRYCAEKYTGTGANWVSWTTQCTGGD